MTKNKIQQEDKVKWPSLKKYNCKRNKGEHEYSEPVIIYKPRVRYIYKTENKSILDSDKLYPEHKFIEAVISLVTETRCKHCNKKVLTFFKEKLK
jgi:hypothetical protein